MLAWLGQVGMVIVLITCATLGSAGLIKLITRNRNKENER
jgi:hypothetical protein